LHYLHRGFDNNQHKTSFAPFIVEFPGYKRIPIAGYPMIPGRRKCVRIRLTNGVTDRSKNLRLADVDLDESMLEKIYENPSTQEVLKWPVEQEEQIHNKTSQVQFVLKLENKEDRVFSEEDMGKTNIHDLMEIQQEDNGGDLIKLILQCSITEEKKEHDGTSETGDMMARPPLTGDDDMMMHKKVFWDHPLSPSILRRNPSSKRLRQRVSFREQSLALPPLSDDAKRFLPTTS
jgi:hypothetical protein